MVKFPVGSNVTFRGSRKGVQGRVIEIPLTADNKRSKIRRVVRVPRGVIDEGIGELILLRKKRK